MTCHFRALFALVFVFLAGHALAGGEERIYFTQEQFLAEAFADKPPAGKVLWLTNELQQEVTRIAGHAPYQMRYRYWSDAVRSAWILEEIGKEEFITAGFVVVDGKIELSRVLTYRESRGFEISHTAWLARLRGIAPNASFAMDRRIDNIAGATLSVNAMDRMMRLALLFDRTAHAKK